MGKIFAISISPKKGMKKSNVPSAELQENAGIIDDAHSKEETRQISLLAFESIKDLQDKGFNVTPGDFAENITTVDLDYSDLAIGDKIMLGQNALIEITQIGKECHDNCSVFKKLGDCIMPREGVFCKVLKSGDISVNDKIEKI